MGALYQWYFLTQQNGQTLGKKFVGIRVIKTNVGNVPERLWNSAVSDNPHIAHTETWYFKS